MVLLNSSLPNLLSRWPHPRMRSPRSGFYMWQTPRPFAIPPLPHESLSEIVYYSDRVLSKNRFSISAGSFIRIIFLFTSDYTSLCPLRTNWSNKLYANILGCHIFGLTLYILSYCSLCQCRSIIELNIYIYKINRQAIISR